MQIDKFITDSDSAFLYLERYVNNGSPSGFSSNTTSLETAPHSTSQSFALPIVQFDDTICVESVGANESFKIPPQSIVCHPDNLKTDIMLYNSRHWHIIDNIIVSPTASGRTVKGIIDHKCFFKLDYYGVLGRIQRNLDSKRLLSAYEVSSAIKDAIQKGNMHNTTYYFEEDNGRIAKIPQPSGGIYEMGYVIRGDKPYPHNEKIKFLIPFFSLFGIDQNARSDKLIIMQLLERQNCNATAFCKQIVTMVIDCYFDVLINCGMCLEAHAQNMLLCLDDNFQILGVAARDMESVDKDLPLRAYLNQDIQFESFPYKCLQRSDYNYTIMHSFMFDFKLGKYLLDALIESFQNVSGFNRKEVIKEIKRMVGMYSKLLPIDYFPMCWYDYENRIFDRSKKRPYIAHDNPRYR